MEYGLVKFTALGPNPFLSSVVDARKPVNILQWIDLHGGVTTLHEVMEARLEAPELVRCQVADFLRDGLIDYEEAGTRQPGIGADPSALDQQSRFALTDSGRLLLKYA